MPDCFPILNISAQQWILKMGLITGLTKGESIERSKNSFSAFHMENLVDIPIKYLSKWTLQKVSAIQAFMSNSDIIFIDESLSGQGEDTQKNFY